MFEIWGKETLRAILGGLLIGISTVLLMHFNGRIAGISGIVSGLIPRVKADWNWRLFFILGLLSSGIIMNQLEPESLVNTTQKNPLVILFAGLLVGFGTALGTGCTSGHGVCGVSRLSKRSIVATLTFLVAGFVTVWLTS